MRNAGANDRQTRTHAALVTDRISVFDWIGSALNRLERKRDAGADAALILREDHHAAIQQVRPVSFARADYSDPAAPRYSGLRGECRPAGADADSDRVRSHRRNTAQPESRYRPAASDSLPASAFPFPPSCRRAISRTSARDAAVRQRTIGSARVGCDERRHHQRISVGVAQANDGCRRHRDVRRQPSRPALDKFGPAPRISPLLRIAQDAASWPISSRPLASITGLSICRSRRATNIPKRRSAAPSRSPGATRVPVPVGHCAWKPAADRRPPASHPSFRPKARWPSDSAPSSFRRARQPCKRQRRQNCIGRVLAESRHHLL